LLSDDYGAGFTERVIGILPAARNARPSCFFSEFLRLGQMLQGLSPRGYWVRSAFLVLWIAVLTGCSSPESQPSASSDNEEWPRCWRFVRTDPDTSSIPSAPSPYRLFADGRASFWMDTTRSLLDTTALASVRWRDVDDGWRIESESPGVWGDFVQIADPISPRSAAVASGYSDALITEYEVEVVAIRFRCQEAMWYSPR
jgi:hypothetical protein